MNAAVVRLLAARLRPLDKPRNNSNRELQLLERLLSYTKQTTRPRSNRELSTILVFRPTHHFKTQPDLTFVLACWAPT
jgi:hypothetical protein